METRPIPVKPTALPMRIQSRPRRCATIFCIILFLRSLALQALLPDQVSSRGFRPPLHSPSFLIPILKSLPQVRVSFLLPPLSSLLPAFPSIQMSSPQVLYLVFCPPAGGLHLV